MWYTISEGREGPKPLALSPFLRPFGFFLFSRLNYQADGGDDCEECFRKVFDYFAYGFIHLLISFPFDNIIIAHIVVLVK